MDAKDAPTAINLFMQMCVFKLGGQVTFTTEDLHDLMVSYAGTRIAYNREDGSVVLTLRSNEAENDRPSQPPLPE